LERIDIKGGKVGLNCMIRYFLSPSPDHNKLNECPN